MPPTFNAWSKKACTDEGGAWEAPGTPPPEDDDDDGDGEFKIGNCTGCKGQCFRRSKQDP